MQYLNRRPAVRRKFFESMRAQHQLMTQQPVVCSQIVRERLKLFAGIFFINRKKHFNPDELLEYFEKNCGDV